MNKVPPQALEMEKAVLGAILLEKEALPIVSEYLRPEMFYDDRNRVVYTAFIELSQKSQPVDSLTVLEQLGQGSGLKTIGGAYYLMELTKSVVSSAHLERHARSIVMKYLLRELGRLGGNLYQRAYEESADPFELMEKMEKGLHQLSMLVNSKDFASINDTLVQIVKELEEKRHRDESLTGVTSGFRELDTHTCGWQPSDLVILAARPKCGKTAKALNWALNAAVAGQGVGFFSMGMSAAQLVKRVLANKSGVFLQTIRDARLDDEQMKNLYSKGIQKLSGPPFYIDDTAALSVAEFKAKARRMVNKFGVKLLVVDYLQLMQPEAGKKGQTRENEISTIARGLKICAKELNVPLIALSQLSRKVEERSSGVPQLSDLRESGSIEQDADMVCFLYRPTEGEINADKSLENRITLKIAAFRNGDPRSFVYDFDGKVQRFEEVAEAKLIPVTLDRKSIWDVA